MQLERRIGEICRKAARETLEEHVETGACDRKKSRKLSLEEKLYTFKKRNEKNDIGIVRGLAWTSVGGDTLQIEVNTDAGQGRIPSDRSAWGCYEGISA